MAEKKIIAVVGSTGAQGGSLVAAILGDPNGGFAARAITRDPTNDKARAIAAKGAEVVQANLDDVESLKKAFAGAYGVYAVTNFWEHFSGEKEKSQARNIADAARAAGVSHVIWSTLEDTRSLMKADDKRMPVLQEKYRVPHFDAKAEANAYFAGLPTTFLLTSFYWDNLYSFGLAPTDTGRHRQPEMQQPARGGPSQSLKQTGPAKAGPSRGSARYCVRRREAARPARPRARSARIPGSGTDRIAQSNVPFMMPDATSPLAPNMLALFLSEIV
jgi:putative NADH-flavin reductase